MIRFSKYIWIYILISGLIIVPGVISLSLFGLRPSIDFTGGIFLEITPSERVTAPKLQEISGNAGLELVNIAQGERSLVLQAKPSDNLATFERDIRAVASDSSTILRLESVGPILGRELLTKAAVAAGIAIIGILLFIAYSFRNFTYGIAAIVALVHDVLVVFGSFSIAGHFFGVSVDTLFVTAFLTTMSFSVHDTIVVFDRIREYGKKGEHLTFSERADHALSETMGRSLANSFTIIFMLFSLVLLGGETIRWFAVALLIGTISGTYSSPFVATPVLLFLSSRMRKSN